MWTKIIASVFCFLLTILDSFHELAVVMKALYSVTLPYRNAVLLDEVPLEVRVRHG